MRIFLVRHAMSMWQVDSSAGLDSGLSPLGRVQAASLARWAIARPLLGPRLRFEPDRMFVSPMLRARQTAAPLEEALGVQAAVCEHLTEPPLSVETLLPVPASPLCSDEASLPRIRHRQPGRYLQRSGWPRHRAGLGSFRHRNHQCAVLYYPGAHRGAHLAGLRLVA